MYRQTQQMEETPAIDLYLSWSGSMPQTIVPIDGEGSSRRYLRLDGPKGAAIACIGSDIKENEAFIYIDGFFRANGLPVPELYAVAPDNSAYLQQDLGNTSLYSLISSSAPTLSSLLHKTLAALPRFQLSACNGFDFNECYPRREFDFRSVMWDLNYFKYCFLKPSGLEIDENSLEDEFRDIASKLSAKSSDGLMLRDFQSRNVMIFDEQPYFIDFQGARKGPALYDVASFLWQARAGFSPTLRDELAETYHKSWIDCDGKPFDDFHRDLRRYALLRTIQVLGAYGFRGLIQNKAKFVTSIPAAISSLTALSALFCDEWPYLHECACRLTSTAIGHTAKCETTGRLRIKVYSFSYKKGIPEDYTGNGGGFVFDCRGLNNPGRYDQYKPLIGLDTEVIEFLESKSDIRQFMDNCFGLVDITVSDYLRRGFTSLTVCFGCTGGRHRSVYGAQHMAEHLATKFPVDVELIHRERGIKRMITGI